MRTVRYESSIEGVDWVALKETLQADDFDNGRTPKQLERSARNSAINIFAYIEDQIVGTVRVLSDGVCNAYMVDIWTLTMYRRQGIAHEMVRLALRELPGQHVYLFTTDQVEFYAALGFRPRGVGLEIQVGDWLDNTPFPAT